MEKELNPNRPDLIFSYWIIVWYVLYIIGFVPYNPKYLFILGIALAGIQFCVMLVYRKSFSYIMAFIIANLILKGVPLFTIFGRKTTKEDVFAMVLSVAMYTLWLKLNNKNLYRFFIEFMTPSVNGRKAFPVINSLQTLLSKL